MSYSTGTIRVSRRTSGDLTHRLASLTLPLLLFGVVTAAPAPAQTEAPNTPQTTTPTTPHTTVAPPPAPAATGVEPIVSMRDAPPTATGAPAMPRKKSYEVDVPGKAWVATALTVSAGETISFSATGSLTLTDARTVTPVGLDRGWKDLLRQFPLNSAKTGSLIGRVSDLGASVPFPIGASADVVMPTSGLLYLAANLSDDLTPSGGSFKVTVRPPALSTPAKTVLLPPATPLKNRISPALFDTIPRRVGDEAGAPGDMVNFAFIGTAEEIKAAFRNAGWVAVDKDKGSAVLHGLLSTLNHEAYVEMPMSTLYLFNRPQDLSFARADPLTVAAERHHLRIWQTSETVGSRPLWVGSATHDIGFERDQRNGGTTHKIDPKIDVERKFLVDSFDAAGNFSNAAYVTPSNPLREAKTATGGGFSSDGRIAVMELKPDLK